MTASGTLATRQGFVDAVREQFDRASIEYAFLGAVEESDKDSDVDVLVQREHLPTVEAVVRSGALGRLVQRMDYDIPWCRYYILATGDPGRPFRQLDVACDPYGISRYGLALARTPSGTRLEHGVPVFRAANRVLYLATKRARKGLVSDTEADQLRRAFESDPAGAAAVLAETWGAAGSAVAAALDRDEDLSSSLRRLGVEVARSRREPRRLALRAWFESRRWLDRARQPTGLVVQVAGPDGSGKSTLADALERTLAGAFRRSSRLHLGPGLLPPPARLLRRTPADTTAPHARATSGSPGSYARIAYLGADALVGWVPRAWLPRARSSLVLLERGWDDLRVDPVRYRLGSGRTFVRLLSRVLPKPDLTLLLHGDVKQITERKPELGGAEVSRQIDAWRELLHERGGSSHEIDTTQPDAAESATGAVVDHLRRRAGDLAEFRLALECLGVPCSSGHAYSVVNAGGRPRWIAPRRCGARGPLGTALYRPASLKHHVGAAAADVAQRLGGVGLEALALDSRVGLAPEVAAALGVDAVELACLLPTDPQRVERATLSVLRRGRPIAFAKVAAAGSAELERERAVLAALGRADLRAIVAPRVVASFGWRRYDVVVLSLVPTAGRTDRPFAASERHALVELLRLTAHMEPTLGVPDGRVLVHGDFSAWNSARHGEQLALWDWEWARYGLPLEDYFHWQTQRLVHFGRLSVSELVTSALAPTPDLIRLCDEANFDPTRAPDALAASLRAGIATANVPSGVREARAEVLARLEGVA
jgi:hypothetical protein